MARQPVVQVQCDRCKRVSLIPAVAEKTVPDFHAVFGAKELKYNDLCEHCKSAIDHIWEDLAQWNREVKQALLGPAVPQNQAPPLQVAPNYTPPQPHSAAGAKRS